MSKEKSIAVLAGGCFWCLQPIFNELDGVERTTVGFTGGEVQNPSYYDVVDGETGHAESIEIEFDPEIISFEKILEVFFKVHDPTTLNRQGNDVGSQYRSAIFYTDSQQRDTANNFIQKISILI